ncbi:hypothetical protein BA190_23985 [Labrys sp. WJW]|uniref:DUF6538 domain-containing protein n=1 Tax=Labrys sp. WJW TaxID=1737983 RepID=UPI00082E4FCB|nr:DUF6538 domain-containing protein [Labrys sp. WJW]OCC02388.1 hypothetical protein BA190_23985 [Labrys sp. WJW]
MALTMSRPFKHPKTGVYYFRKAVPDDLRALVGRREEKRTLRTKDPREARERFTKVAAEVASEWMRLRSNPQPTGLSRRDALALAGRWYLWFTSAFEEEPGSCPEGWRLLADGLEDARQWGTGHPDEYPDDEAEERPSAVTKAVHRYLMEHGRVSRFLSTSHGDGGADGLRLSDDGIAAFLAAVELQFFAAMRLLSRWTEGDYRKDERPTTFPEYRPAPAPLHPSSLPPSASPEVTLKSLFSGWAAERKPPEKTRYNWERVIEHFAAHVKVTAGHDDAARVVKADVVGWKDALVADGKAAKTIRDSRLAPLRAILQWAVDNDKLKANPADGIKLAVKERGGGRRGFTDAEAMAILKAARASDNPRKAHYRWVPWICALSGARLSEVCQLRGSDIQQTTDGQWTMHLTWEAGSLKNTGSERVVPLHSALVAEGFATFARSVGQGPLFTGLTPDRFGSRGGNGTKVLGRWVREVLEIDDPRIGPNHSWRHRFKTLCRIHGIGKDYHDAITGHAHADEGDGYGDFPVEALAREIEKLPPPVPESS